MIIPFLKLTATQEGWQAVFAFQVFHRPAEEWMKMRWGFNAGALLDEALDRYKLFIESQAVHEAEFQAGRTHNNTLVLRGIHQPESGLKMVLLGKSTAHNQEQAKETALQYAREVSSTFPHDFLLSPAETESEYHLLSGEYLLARNSNVAKIQRGTIFLPTAQGPFYLTGLWQASSRSNEQIWRALSAMPREVLFNIAVQPTILYDGEKATLLNIKKSISNPTQKNEAISAYIPWTENYIKRRLTVWKKFFVVQIHLVVDEGMENLIHSIGAALTRDSNELALPGFQALYPSSTAESQEWRERIRSLDLIQNTFHLNELADLDEVYSIFRFPYRPEAGLPGTDFIELVKKTDPTQEEQKP
jgi:hypothetical protein